MMNRQAFAALRTAAFQHFPSVLGRHSRPEAMLFRAAAVVRLICSLRHNCSPLNSPESENLKSNENSPKCQSSAGKKPPTGVVFPMLLVETDRPHRGVCSRAGFGMFEPGPIKTF